MIGGRAARLRALWAAAALLIAWALLLMLRAATLAVYPPWQVIDEPWNFGFALVSLRDGVLSDPLMLELTGKPAPALPPFLWLTTGWLAATGQATPLNARLFHLLLTVPLVVACGWVAWTWWGGRGRITLWTCAVLVGSVTLAYAARIRHDVGLATALALTLALHTRAARPGAQALHLLAGLTIGLGSLAHLRAAGFGVALLIGLYGPGWVASGRLRPPTPLLLFALGGALGALPLAVRMTLLGSDTFVATVGNASRFAPDGLLFARVMGRHVLGLGGFSWLEWALFAVGLVVTALDRRPAARTLFGVAVLLHLALAMMTVNNFSHYYVQLLPVYALLWGLVLARAAPLVGGRGAWLAAALLLSVWLSSTLTPTRALLARGAAHIPAPPGAGWLAADLPARARVMGTHDYYLWLYDRHTYMSSQYAWYALGMGANDAPRNDVLATLPTRLDAVWATVDADVIVWELDRELENRLLWFYGAPGFAVGPGMAARGYTFWTGFYAPGRHVLVYRRVP